MSVRPSTPRFGFLAYFVLLAGLTFFNKSVGLIVDFAWFKEVGLLSVFKVTFLSKWGLGLLGGAAVAITAFLNLRLARRWSKQGPVIALAEEEEDLIGTAQLREWREASRPILTAACFLGAFFAGVWASSHWETVLQFWHASSFGTADPIFQKDVGFYVFKLPFYDALFSFAQTAALVAGGITLATYFLEGSIFISTRGLKMPEPAKKHLAFWGAVLCLLAAGYFQLKIYGLLNQQRAVAPGPGYSDLHAYLPILRLLPAIALISAALCAAAVFKRGSGAWAALGLVALVIGSFGAAGYREIVQRLAVAPNEIVKETPYIQYAIESTRRAYGLDNVQELEFDPDDNLTRDALRRNDLTIKNIRLWDHVPLLTTYSQLQEIRTYYEFMDVDNDRYHVDGEYRQVMLSPRELNPASLPSRIWINEHLTYTHGYGLTLGPVNRISQEGLPEFFIKDIPPRTTHGFQVTRPQIYFGEARGSYAIVNTRSKEFDYPSGDENIYTRYEGTGGVPLNGFASKLLFALYFKELKTLLSSDITRESRILYFRNILERVNKAAPFLRYDQDPYLVISKDGRLYWIIDAYTSTDRYPFSMRIRGVGSYIRNSVKVVVDAYHGSLDFYVADPSDPLIQTYAKIFPNVLKPIDTMPEDLKSHLRYPQDLFSIQAHIYATYHMTDSQVFYNKEDLWKIPEKSGAGRQTQRMAPYYTIMKLASVGKQEEFILMVPFTPARKENMIAWMAARCDAPNYGKLLVYNFPKQKLVYGPQQIDSRIDQDAEIAKQLTLWNQGGSQVIRGSLLVIPVESSLLYVQPLYLEATGGGLPELKRVIVAYGNAIAMEETLEASLNQIFGGRMGSGIRRTTEEKATDLSSDLKTLARQAQGHFERAQSYLRQGNWSGYGQEIAEVERLLKQLSVSR
jgi:uncharacterized protein